MHICIYRVAVKEGFAKVVLLINFFSTLQACLFLLLITQSFTKTHIDFVMSNSKFVTASTPFSILLL